MADFLYLVTIINFHIKLSFWIQKSGNIILIYSINFLRIWHIWTEIKSKPLTDKYLMYVNNVNIYLEILSFLYHLKPRPLEVYDNPGGCILMLFINDCFEIFFFIYIHFHHPLRLLCLCSYIRHSSKEYIILLLAILLRRQISFGDLSFGINQDYNLSYNSPIPLNCLTDANANVSSAVYLFKLFISIVGLLGVFQCHLYLFFS